MFEINSYFISFLSFVSLIAFLIWRKFTYWYRRGVPGPCNISWDYAFGIHHDITYEKAKKYGRVYGGYTLIGRQITINEPDLLRDIMVKDFNIFRNRRQIYVGESKVNLSLFLLPGNDDWKRIHSIVSPAFSSGKLKAMMSNISDISDKLVNNLVEFEKTGEVIDIRKYMGAFAMDVISACAYGINVDSINNTNHPFVVNIKKIMGLDLTVGMLLSALAPPLAQFLKIEVINRDSVRYFDKLTQDILNERKKINNNEFNEKIKRSIDFIQLMIDSENKSDLKCEPKIDVDMTGAEAEPHQSKSKKTLSTDEMVAQGIFFFVAGYDTISAALTHTIYFLSKHKDIQQRLYEELQTLTDYSYESLIQLKYLNAVINETLRLTPSLTRIERECQKDYKLGNTGITIPGGTLVVILPYALHRDSDFWPDPEEFQPERFLEPKHHSFAYIPFGCGPRVCLGQRFALNAMRMCIAQLFKSYQFSLAKDFKLEYFICSPIVSPKSLLVQIGPRQV